MSVRQGSNIIAGVGTNSISNAHNLLDFKWSDRKIYDVSWLRADTFSWQDGTVYSNAYQHLLADITGKTLQSETIGSTTIQFYLADDGHKICPSTQETNVNTIYTNTGVAWYYIVDTTNQRFKLPRTKYGFTGLRNSVGGYVPESLPNIRGETGRFNLSQLGNSGAEDSALYTTSTSGTGSSTNNIQVPILHLDASRSSSTYKDNAPVQQRATQMYLYFYVGQFSQSATEQTAGINTELFNQKADTDLSNINASAKQTIVGLGIPDYSAGIALSGWTTSNTNFTIPKDGVVYVKIVSASALETFYIDDIAMSSLSNASTYTGTAVGFISLKKGQHTWRTSSTASRVNSVIFYPFQGA